MISLQLQLASSQTAFTIGAAQETLKYTNSGLLLGFHAYIGLSDHDEPLYIAYVLSHDNSARKKSEIHATTDAAIVSWKMQNGYVEGANSSAALRKGPNAMRAAALTGAKRGFKYGLLWVAAKEIATHIYHSIEEGKNRHQQHYYVSPDGPDFLAPIYLKVS
jgi:hypothetical protein